MEGFFPMLVYRRGKIPDSLETCLPPPNQQVMWCRALAWVS